MRVPRGCAKKLLAAALSVFLPLMAVLPCFAAAPDGALCFAVASDLHYNPADAALEQTNDDPLYFYANRRCAMENESGFILDAFLRQCAGNDAVRYVLISGDLADDGKFRPEDHRAVAEKLAAFERDSGKDVFVINGNHDASMNPGDTSFDDFTKIYADFGYDKALSRGDDDCSYTADLGENYRLIALDSCSRTKSTEDGMTIKKINWVLKAAAQAKKDGRQPVLMMHHNLLDHLPAQRVVSHDFIVRFHFSTAALFADAGIRLALTGHEHCSDARSFTSPAGNTIFDFATTSLSMYPLSYRIFTLTDGLIAYEAPEITSVDTAALSAGTAGYTEEQLRMLQTDCNGFAKGFLKTGIRYRLSLSLSDEKLGIDPSAFYYPPVKTAVGGLLRLLQTPYAGEGGLMQAAARYNMTLPETAYETPWDLATDLAAAHYAGEEPHSPDTPAVRLLLKTAALLLRTDLAGVGDEVFLAAANRLLHRSGDEGIAASLSALCFSVFGGVKPGEYFLAVLLYPLLYEFGFDGDGVSDNAGSVPGYGAQQSENGRLQRFTVFAERFVLYLQYIFKSVFSGIAPAGGSVARL